MDWLIVILQWISGMMLLFFLGYLVGNSLKLGKHIK